MLARLTSSITAPSRLSCKLNEYNLGDSCGSATAPLAARSWKSNWQCYLTNNQPKIPTGNAIWSKQPRATQGSFAEVGRILLRLLRERHAELLMNAISPSKA